VDLLGVTLPADGTYHVRVQAAPAQAGGTGNYQLGVFDATTRDYPLNLNDTVTGRLPTPYNIDRYSFTATSGDQVQFHLINVSDTAVVFDLTGSNGYTAFTSATADSAPITLPATGSYVLSVHTGGNGSQGTAYAFQVVRATVTDLTLDSTYQGTLQGSGQSQLFRVQLNTTGFSPVFNAPQHETIELLARYGFPPTRNTYDYDWNVQDLEGPPVLWAHVTTKPGVWYFLVYARNLDAPVPFQLTAATNPFDVTYVTPSVGNAGQDSSLNLTGVGFAHGAGDPQNPYNILIVNDVEQVSLVSSDGHSYNLSYSFNEPTDSFQATYLTWINATIPAGTIPAGLYTVRLTNTWGGTTELPNAYRILPGVGAGVLKTDLAVPNPIGYHIASTIYVTYSNVGTAPLAAPLLVLTATQNGKQGALLTLDPTKVTSGFWTSATPDGYSQSVQFLASGVKPGIL
jgi:hypothetical protein